jgi:sporulation protein YlmC with PRC-barrel domain
MATGDLHIEPKSDDATAPLGMLAHLSDLHDFRLAEGEPDIRGWDVVLPDGRRAGKVEDLIVDTDDLSVRYLEVRVRGEILGTDEDTYVLVPVSAARLDDDDDRVVVDRLPGTGLAAAPRFARGVPTDEQERSIREYYGAADRAAEALDHRAGDQRRFWGQRRTGREGSPLVSRGQASAPPVEAVVVEEVIVDGVIVEPPAGSGSRERGSASRPADDNRARP